MDRDNVRDKAEQLRQRNILLKTIDQRFTEDDRDIKGIAYHYIKSGLYDRDMKKNNEQNFQCLIDYLQILKAKRPVFELYNDDFRKIGLSDESVDIIITDPPYPKQYLDCYRDLALFAERVLKPGGSLITMAGQSYLPEVISLMNTGGNLKYHWTICYLTPGGQSPQIWPRKINTFWKPVLWYVKGKYERHWVGDVAKSSVNDNDKRFHHWGQSESGMKDLIERFSRPGETILDPFLGGGTTGIVTIMLHRRFIGIEIDKKTFEKASDRIIAAEPNKFTHIAENPFLFEDA